MEPGAPDDVGHIETTVVFELGVSVLHPGDAERSTPAAARSFGLTLIGSSPVDTIVGRALLPIGVPVVRTRWKMIRAMNGMRIRAATLSGRNEEVTGVRSGQPDVVGSRQLHGDLCPRVAGSDHKDTSGLELTGVAVSAT